MQVTNAEELRLIFQENAKLRYEIKEIQADYEARLKADMVAMFEDLKKEMNPIKECEYQIYGKEPWNFVGKCQDVVQQKINELKENEDGTNEETSD